MRWWQRTDEGFRESIAFVKYGGSVELTRLRRVQTGFQMTNHNQSLQ